MQAGLVVQYARDWRLIGSSLELQRWPVDFGRSPEAAIYMEEARLSRKHAELDLRGGRVLLVDCGSANGSFVNGQRVVQPIVVQSGDRITVGATTFLFAAGFDMRDRIRTEVSRLRELDPVSGTLSKSLLLEWLEREVVEDYVNPRALSALFLELDRHREFVERGGEVVADTLVRGAAAEIARQRPAAFPFRVAADKLVVLLFGSDLGAACAEAESLRQHLEDARFPLGTEALSSTATFGVAQLARGDKRSVDFLRRAERACADAKKDGRNRVAARTFEE